MKMLGILIVTMIAAFSFAPTANAAILQSPTDLELASSAATLCPYSSPIPGAPVGGVVGQAYTGAKGAADSGAGAGVGVTCSTIGFVGGLVNPTCQFLIGTDCL